MQGTDTHAQACLTLCDPMDRSPPGSTIHGILQARIRSKLPVFPSPGDLPDPGMEPAIPVLPGGVSTTTHLGSRQCRGHGFDPWSGKISHAVGQLSPHTTTTEAVRPRARALQQEASLQRRLPPPLLQTRQSPKLGKALTKQ